MKHKNIEMLPILPYKIALALLKPSQANGNGFAHIRTYNLVDREYAMVIMSRINRSPHKNCVYYLKLSCSNFISLIYVSNVL